MKASEAALPAGIVLLFLAPLVALTPVFTPPPGGCPCPQGLPVTTPFADVAIVVGIFGALLAAYGGAKRLSGFPNARPLSSRATMATAVSGLGTLVVGYILSSFELTGPGWSIVLYEAQGFYLEALGTGVLLFAGLVVATKSEVGSLFLSAGGVLDGLSLLFTFVGSSDFLLRCSPGSGCSSTLAISTVEGMIAFGYVLAIGAFLLGLGLSIVLSNRARAQPQTRESARSSLPPWTARAMALIEVIRATPLKVKKICHSSSVFEDPGFGVKEGPTSSSLLDTSNAMSWS